MPRWRRRGAPRSARCAAWPAAHSVCALSTIFSAAPALLQSCTTPATIMCPPSLAPCRLRHALLWQGAGINVGLLNLGIVIRELAGTGSSLFYRNSILTEILKPGGWRQPADVHACVHASAYLVCVYVDARVSCSCGGCRFVRSMPASSPPAPCSCVQPWAAAATRCPAAAIRSCWAASHRWLCTSPTPKAHWSEWAIGRSADAARGGSVLPLLPLPVVPCGCPMQPFVLTCNDFRWACVCFSFAHMQVPAACGDSQECGAGRCADDAAAAAAGA